jgi:hypothetical protein
MNEQGKPDAYYWCLKHNRVETGKDRDSQDKLLGPYATRAEAERALQTVAERNDRWDAEDRRWHGED